MRGLTDIEFARLIALAEGRPIKDPGFCEGNCFDVHEVVGPLTNRGLAGPGLCGACLYHPEYPSCVITPLGRLALSLWPAIRCPQ